MVPTHTDDLSFGDPARGEPLPPDLRSRLEGAFCVDLQHIRVHLGPQARRRGVGAFAHGTDLYFAPENFRPDDSIGASLVVHELVHVFQQASPASRGPIYGAPSMLIDETDEALAGDVGDLFARDPAGAGAMLRAACPGTVFLAPRSTRWDRLQPNVHVEVGGRDFKLTDVDQAMARISAGITDGEIGPAFEQLKHLIRPVLKDWIKASRNIVKRFIAGRNENTVRYHSWNSIARALLGEVRAAGNKTREAQLALDTENSHYINEQLAGYLAFVSECLRKPRYAQVQKVLLPTIGWYSKEYSTWYPTGGIKKILSSPSSCAFKHKVAGIHDIVAAFGRIGDYDEVPDDKCVASALVPNGARGYNTVRSNMLNGDKLSFRVGSLRDLDCTLIEESEIIMSYRDNSIPVGFGPSFTTGRTVQCCHKLCLENGKGDQQRKEWINAIAWGLFAFWNRHYERRYSRCHSFHEAMDMASNYGVPYTPFRYPRRVPDDGEPFPVGEMF